jgi:HAE1 family hydrophobic/amphiphilic exporter-1
MNVARWSVTRPVAVTMRIAALVLLGLMCLMRLPIDLLPRVDIPIVSVNTSWANTPPEVMEAQVTRPVEQAVASVPGLYSVSSTSSLGSSNVRVTLNYGVDVNQAAVDVLQAVQRAQSSFPNDPQLQRPAVYKFDPASLPILVYGVTGEKDLIKLRTTLENDISPVLESAGGVAAVNISGGQERAIIVDVDPVKLQAFGIPVSTIEDRIAAENNTRPGGIAARGGREYTIRAEGYLRSAKEFASLPIETRDGRVIPISQVATVRDSAQEQRVFLTQNGVPAASIAITKQANANTVETSKAIEAKVETLKKSYPNLKFTVAYQQAGFIVSSIDELKETAIIGGVLAILVITFFLRNIRSTLVVALSIPISIISTFAIMYFGGFTLNTISLSGLALASGLIVDDAIVVLENIFRHMEGGKRRAADAAVSGAQEIMSAVVASTFTIMVVFLPLFLIKGQSGQTFTQFALVVIFSIAVSLLDATTVVPMLASRFIKEKEVEEVHHPEHIKSRISFFRWAGFRLNALDAAYRRILENALRKRWWVLGGAIALSVVAFPLVNLVGFETLPQTDSGDFQVNMRLPIGTDLATTRKWANYLERNLLADPDVEAVFVGAGANVSFRGAGGSLPYRGGATVRLKRDRKSSTEEVINRLKPVMAKIPGRTNASPFDMVANILGGNSQGIEVDVFGSNLQDMQNSAKVVQDALGNVPGLESVDISVEDASPEIRFDVDRAKANALGVSYDDLANAVSTATAGSQVGYFQDPKDAQQYPIFVQFPVESRRSIPDILNLPVKTLTSTAASSTVAPTVLLRQVATVRESTGPNQIARLNRQRYIAISGRVADRSESAVQADVAKTMETLKLPPGTRWDFGERQRRRAEEFSGLGLAVLLAIALIYTLLASQFESFIYPLIVLCSVPLCAPGVIVGLLLAGQAFGLTAYVGVLMLVGIVVKNGILLVDYTNQLRSRGQSRDEAILHASPTRLRPILMTSLCAILGMLPLAIGLGNSSKLQAPLATAVVGGLLTSTALTLFVVPVVYTFFDDLARRFRGSDLDLAHAQGVEPSLVSSGGEPEQGPPLAPTAVEEELR